MNCGDFARHFGRYIVVAFMVWLGARNPIVADETIESSEPSIEQRAIALLLEKCANCHGQEKREGEFSVISRADLVHGGTLGSALDAMKPQQSLLLKVVQNELPGLEMPPKNPLTESEIQLVKDWLQGGALWITSSAANTADANANSTATGSAWEDANNPVRKKWFGERLNHWSLHPLSASTMNPENSILASKIPPSESAIYQLPQNALDVLVDQRRIELGINSVSQADKATLLRRLYLDVTGLPPTYDEVQGFLQDSDPDAYQKRVDQLLSVPAYGEHFGRLWLDVVRYSDSNGFDWDEYRPQAWRFRNYVIDAWNDDLPYDEFIIEQLAGDELLTGNPQHEQDLRRLVATGFLRLGPFDNAAPLFNEQDRSRAEFLSDITETAGSAFLGQTLACCRCHDHKTDPWLQSDYYRFKAFFAAVEFGDETPLEVEKRREEINQHNTQIETEIAPLQAEVDSLLKTEKPSKEIKDKIATLKDDIKKLNDKLLHPQRGLIVREDLNKIPATHVFYQGDHQALREVVEPGIPSMFQPNSYSVTATERTSGRRLALARWIASPENPWTARVIVNRLWLFHFGEGLVRTPNDFGWSGEAPESIALLDWLAQELIQHQWSLKHIQRLIVSSRTYQEATHRDVWPRKLKRLSAEQLRDSMLAVSGLLQTRQATSPIWPPVPEDVLKANPATLDDNETKTKGWYPSPSQEQSVRSVYLVQKRTIRVPFMETFDLPDNSVSCGCRTVSIVAPQALSMLNGDWATEAAEGLAHRVEKTLPGSTSKQIEAIFQAVFQRQPSDIEHQRCVQFLETRRLAELTRALLNTNEFAFVE